MSIKHKSHQPPQSDSVVVSSDSRLHLPSLVVYALMIVVVAAVLVIMVLLIVGRPPSTSGSVSTTTDPALNGLSDDYLNLTPDQAATKLKAETGLDLATLATQKLTDKSFKNFDQANKAAQALYAAGKFDKSYEAFKIAANNVPKNVDYHFYLNYASLADLKGDQQLKLQLVNKAKEAIKNDSSLSASRKAYEIDKIDQKL